MPRRYRRDGGDGSSQYETTSQQSHTQMSGGLMESLSLWSAQFTNLSSVSNSTIDGDERNRLTNRALAMLLGRRTKETLNEVMAGAIPTRPRHDDDDTVDVEGGGDTVAHNDAVEGEKGMINAESNKNSAPTDDEMTFAGVLAPPVQPQPQQQHPQPFPQPQVI